ncbi:MAG: pyridoxal-dependent decarboxylase [Myxococcota bacterium]
MDVFGPDDLRTHGRDVIDWLAGYLERVPSLPVRSPLAPGAILERIGPQAPEEGEALTALVADLEDVVLPGVTHWQSPGWLAYFPANSTVPSVLADLAAAGLGQQGMLWATSPACTEIEMAMMNWLVTLLGLPAAFRMDGPGGGVIQMTASDATHLALVVARNRARAHGPIESMVVYASGQAHSSIEKGARIAGFEHVVSLPVDDTFALRPDALARAIAADRAAGRVPAFVNTTVGTTGTTAIDPVRAVGEIARAEGIWHHVDAAYAGTAMICPELRPLQDGLELCDSYVFNPHKWMGVGFDCSCFFVADRKPLLESMSISPPYLRADATEAREVVDYRDWQLALGRRFRALKLWFVLRAYGAEGLRTEMRRHLALAADFAAWVDGRPDLERIAPVPLALVCFRHRGGDAPTEGLAQTINDGGALYITLSSTPEVGAFIRVSIGHFRTEAHHLDRLKATIDAFTTPSPNR